MISQDRLERVWSKIEVVEQGDCWNWTATKSKQGYGRIWVNGKLKHATHVVWFLMHGHWPCRFPDGEVIAHSCDNPSCCNPSHLFLTTQSGNMRDAAEKRRLWNQVHGGRAAGPSLVNKLKTHCINGHPLSGDNLKIVGKRKMRRCVACFRERDKIDKRWARIRNKERKVDFSIQA